MKKKISRNNGQSLRLHEKALVCALMLIIIFPFNIFSAIRDYNPGQEADAPSLPVPLTPPPASAIAGADTTATRRAAVPDLRHKRRTVAPPDSSAAAKRLEAFPDTMWIESPVDVPVDVVGDSIIVEGDSTVIVPIDTVPVDNAARMPLPVSKANPEDTDPDYRQIEFSPDPTRAVWLSALFPGLGQLYNRRYWKLPIVVGAFMGLTYATSWNNEMLDDYTRAYRDLMDNDPSTDSYMDFYPPGTQESQLNRTWMENTFKARKDFYRRNRDLCIIAMVGVYLIAMVDAYVDASLSHFDISPDLSMDVSPTLIPDSRSSRPGIGVQWAFTF